MKELFLPIAPTIQIATSNDQHLFNKSAIQPLDTTGYKTIAWQHLGAGTILDQRAYYKSARTNRPIIYPPLKPKFGSLAQSLDASAYRGGIFRVTAKVKLISGTGTGHIWARVDNSNKTVGFFDNMATRPISSTEWSTYSITGKIDSNAAQLVTGVFMEDAGEVWIDDFTVSVNINNNKWQIIYTNTFDNQQTGIANTGFLTGGVSGQPSPDYIYSTVSDAKEPQQKFASIKSKFSSDNDIEEHSFYFNEFPKVGEYFTKEIGAGIKVIIPLALYGTAQHTYPSADTAKLEQLLKGLNSIKASSINGNDLFTRLATINISWNIFQHFFPYFDFAKTNWSQNLREALTDAYEDKDAADFQRTLERMTAKLKDGHIVVDRIGDLDTYMPPLKWEWIQGNLVVTKVFDPSVKLHQADIITAIDGKNPEDYFKDAEQFISAATPGHLIYRAQYSTLAGQNGSSISLTVQGPDNVQTQIKLNRTLSHYAYFTKVASQDTVKAINKDVMYLNVSTTPMKSILRHLDQLRSSKVIICDLRGYPYDESPFIQYLLTKPDTTKWMFTPHIIYPDQEKIAGYDIEGANLKPLSPHINAKIIFIIDSQDISAAESFMSFIEYYKLATIIGQPTAGTNGVGNRMYLPGGYSIQFTGGMKVLKLDGSQQHGVGTKPDIYLEKTIEGIKENKDEFLDKAIEMANSYIK